MPPRSSPTMAAAISSGRWASAGKARRGSTAPAARATCAAYSTPSGSAPGPARNTAPSASERLRRHPTFRRLGNDAFRTGILAPQPRPEGYNCPDRVPEQATVPRKRTIPPFPEPSDAIVANLLKQFAQSSQLGANAAFIEDLYEQYLVDPDSVGDKWKAWFDGFQGREAGDVPHSV